MGGKPVNIPLDAEQAARLGEIAVQLDEPLTKVVGEAIDHYLEARRFRAVEARKALQAVEAGEELVPHEKVMSELRAHIERREHEG